MCLFTRHKVKFVKEGGLFVLYVSKNKVILNYALRSILPLPCVLKIVRYLFALSRHFEKHGVSFNEAVNEELRNLRKDPFYFYEVNEVTLREIARCARRGNCEKVEATLGLLLLLFIPCLFVPRKEVVELVKKKLIEFCSEDTYSLQLAKLHELYNKKFKDAYPLAVLVSDNPAILPANKTLSKFILAVARELDTQYKLGVVKPVDFYNSKVVVVSPSFVQMKLGQYHFADVKLEDGKVTVVYRDALEDRLRMVERWLRNEGFDVRREEGKVVASIPLRDFEKKMYDIAKLFATTTSIDFNPVLQRLVTSAETWKEGYRRKLEWHKS